MSIHMLGLAALAAAAPIAIFTAPALAAATESASVAVPYRDLDLASEAGQAELDRRIDRAARHVCGLDQQRTGTRLRASESRKCYREARQALDTRMAEVVRGRAVG